MLNHPIEQQGKSADNSRVNHRKKVELQAIYSGDNNHRTPELQIGSFLAHVYA